MPAWVQHLKLKHRLSIPSCTVIVAHGHRDRGSLIEELHLILGAKVTYPTHGCIDAVERSIAVSHPEKFLAALDSARQNLFRINVLFVAAVGRHSCLRIAEESWVLWRGIC
jgi:hypothetical protein